MNLKDNSKELETIASLLSDLTKIHQGLLGLKETGIPGVKLLRDKHSKVLAESRALDWLEILIRTSESEARVLGTVENKIRELRNILKEGGDYAKAEPESA